VIHPKLISEITKEAGGNLAEGAFKKNYLNLFTFPPKCLKNTKRQRLRDVEFSKFENKPKTFEILQKTERVL
jgi:hypothetical protein